MRRRATNLAQMMLLSFGLGGWAFAAEEFGPPLPGTKPLTMSGDIASELVAGVDRFLLQQIDESTAKRPAATGSAIFSSARAYEASIEPNRKRLAHILGVRGSARPAPRIKRMVDRSSRRAKSSRMDQKAIERIHSVSWPAFGDVTGEGLELGTGEPA